MMSLPVWLPSHMFLAEDLCLWPHVPSWGSLSRGSLCPRRLCAGVSVQGSLRRGSLCRGSRCRGPCPGGHYPGDLCQGANLFRGVSVQGSFCSGGSLSRGASVWGGLCPGGHCPGSLCPEGFLSWRCPRQRLSPVYGKEQVVRWNAFLDLEFSKAATSF